MCGISGIVGPAAKTQTIKSMASDMKHRGPDHTGYFVKESEVALGHNRLSIIDLSTAANQPFISDDGRFVLIFNGEIYNYLEIRKSLSEYVFKTNSDTEVLLRAWEKWGQEAIHKLNGMFSFAIYDNRKQELFAARDRFGVKPFFYSTNNKSFYFASEISPLFLAGLPKIPQEEVWASYFAFGSYGMPDQSFWKGILQLPAGHSLEWASNKLIIKKWYDFEARVTEQMNIFTDNDEDYITQLLLDATRLRFRADVPVGFNLSGGLDSSTLLALIHHQFPNNDKIEAFTFYTGNPNYDELPWVKGMLSGKNYPLNTSLLKVEEVPDLAVKISNGQMEPYGGIPTLAYAKVFDLARRKGILVLLDGQGSDEAWAGYDYYINNSNSVVQVIKGSPVKPDVLNDSFFQHQVQPNYPKPFTEHLLNLQFRDLFYTKIPRALRFSDRISMLHSTELREPFLDYRLVEFVFSRPESFKIKGGVQKWLLRKIASTFLDNEITTAPKRPLQTPQREWLGNELKEWACDHVHSLHGLGWFDTQKLEKELDQYMSGNQENSFYLWQWINTSLLLTK